jgi:hypothetical protein
MVELRAMVAILGLSRAPAIRFDRLPSAHRRPLTDIRQQRKRGVSGLRRYAVRKARRGSELTKNRRAGLRAHVSRAAQL